KTHRVQFPESQTFNDQLLLLVEADGAPVILNLQFSGGRFSLRSHKLPQYLFQRFLAKPRNVLWIFEIPKALEGRLDHVVRVGRSDRLRKNVLDACSLHDSANSTTRYYPRSFDGRFQQYAAGPE